MKGIIHFPGISIMGMDRLGVAIGKAVKRLTLADQITGIDATSENPDPERMESGIVDEWTKDMIQGIRECDFLILNLPSEESVRLIPQIASNVKPGCIVTDACALKKNIMEQAGAHFPGDRFFIGSHLMIIEEKANGEGEDVEFQDKTAFVTFVSDTDQTALARVSLFWKALGMVPFLIDPERHDRYMAHANQNPSFKKILEERNIKEWMQIISTVPEL